MILIENLLGRMTIVLAIMLLVPQICRRIHIPSIVGFILCGLIAGPKCLGLIMDNDAIGTLGKMGILYIMLQSGVEIDVNDFSLHRRHAILFGFITFLIPAMLGYLTGRLLLGYNIETCALLGAMYGSHTLMTYPIVSRYGIQKSAAVNITVGGTMVAIALSLIGLAVIESTRIPDAGWQYWMAFAAESALFFIIVLGLIPRLAHYFFRHIQGAIAGFTFVMTMLVLSAYLAELAHLEGILGAFACGVALNKHIPTKSRLMADINLAGNGIFVPIFLIGVGEMIDIRILFSGGTTILLVAGVMIATKLAGKWMAAWMAEKAFHLSTDERRLVFGLSHATAAGTLAVATIGYQSGILSIEILNASILMILVLCTTSSFITEYAAKQMALSEDARLESEREENKWLLMSIGIDTVEDLHQLATLSDLEEPEFRLCEDWKDAMQHIERQSESAIIYHGTQPISTIHRILVAVPRFAEKEWDFISCFGQIRRMSGQLGAKVVFYCNEDTQPVLRTLCNRQGKYLRASYQEMNDWEEVLMLAKEAGPDDMIVFINARPSTPSYNPLFKGLTGMLDRFFSTYNYIVLYPEQDISNTANAKILMDIPQASTTWSLVSAIKQWLLKQMRKLQHTNS